MAVESRQSFRPTQHKLNTMALNGCYQPKFVGKIIANLACMALCNNAHIYLALHLIYDHFQDPYNNVLWGLKSDNTSIGWANSAAVDSPKASTLHGYVLVVTDQGPVSCDLEDGALLDLSSIHKGLLGD
jgi:hypothetical protein